MKPSTLLTMVIASAVAAAAAAAAAHGIPFQKHVRTILINAPGDMTPVEAQFCDDMWRNAFNLIHNHESVFVTRVAIESQQAHQQPDFKMSALMEARNWWNYQIVDMLVTGECGSCGVNNKGGSLLGVTLLASGEGTRIKNLAPQVIHRQFEEKLRTILRSGPFDYFRDIEECIVDFSPAGTSFSSSAVAATENHYIGAQVETIFVGTPGTMEDPSLVMFFEDTWRETYNTFHDPSEIYIESVTLDRDEIARDLRSCGGCDASTPGGYFEDTFSIITGLCNACVTMTDKGALYDDIGPEPQGVRAAVVHRLFEAQLCLNLKGGFAFFNGVQECIVTYHPLTTTTLTNTLVEANTH